jgi:hypothetical protein
MGQGIVLFPETLATPEVIARYVAFIFVAACGAIQIGAAVGGINGLLFVRKKRLALFIGGALLVSAFASFFGWYFTDQADRPRGLEGNEQAILFAASSAGALLFTIILASLLQLAQRLYKGLPVVQRPVQETQADRLDGLDALREASYLDVVAKRMPPARQ